jgi:hypothetical protein
MICALWYEEVPSAVLPRPVFLSASASASPGPRAMSYHLFCSVCSYPCIYAGLVALLSLITTVCMAAGVYLKPYTRRCRMSKMTVIGVYISLSGI